MFCSVIIPTIGRDTLARAVDSVLRQSFMADDFEVIVVNDSGRPLDDAPWQHEDRVQVIHTMRRERSVARNAGAAIATGKYLCFLDDDDWLLPGALEEMWSLANRAPDSAWLYGAIQVVDESGRILAEINSALEGNRSAQVMGGAWIPIQSSFIDRAAFFTAGGFDPFICGTEDQDLCRRITLHGSLANTPAVVACLFRGETWHTSTDYLRAAEDTRISRDAVLNKPGAFGRLHSSANSSYWRGRLLRVYLSTINYNLRQRKITRTMSRTLFGLAALVLSGRYVFSSAFWQACRADHVPNTLHFVMAASEATDKNQALKRES